MARCIYAWLFLILVYFFLNNSLLSQLQSPVLFTVESDNTYWILHLINIPQLLLKHHGAALGFDVILTTSCLIIIFLPDNQLFTWLTVVGCWILYICYCSAAGHHFAQIGFLLPPMAFLVKDQIKFELLWKLIRYWICFLYLCTGIYKLYYGGFFYQDNMAEILRFMNGEYLFFHDNSYKGNIVSSLIESPEFAQWLFRIVTIIDLTLIVGFFTYRFDRWIAAGLLLFHIGNYFLLHISFVEQSLIFAAFLPWQNIAGRIINTQHDD